MAKHVGDKEQREYIDCRFVHLLVLTIFIAPLRFLVQVQNLRHMLHYMLHYMTQRVSSSVRTINRPLRLGTKKQHDQLLLTGLHIRGNRLNRFQGNGLGYSVQCILWRLGGRCLNPTTGSFFRFGNTSMPVIGLLQARILYCTLSALSGDEF